MSDKFFHYLEVGSDVLMFYIMLPIFMLLISPLVVPMLLLGWSAERIFRYFKWRLPND